MLAKTESADHVDALAGRDVIALCETAKGVLAAAVDRGGRVDRRPDVGRGGPARLTRRKVESH